MSLRPNFTARTYGLTNLSAHSAGADHAVPYTIHTVLTDNGIHFATLGAGGSAVPLLREAIANGELFHAHALVRSRYRQY